MRKPTMAPAVALAALGAAGIAIMSAAFGVGMARLLWADDLKFARHIDEIRSRTEGYLKEQIVALEQQIKTLKRQ